MRQNEPNCTPYIINLFQGESNWSRAFGLADSYTQSTQRFGPGVAFRSLEISPNLFESFSFQAGGGLPATTKPRLSHAACKLQWFCLVSGK